MGIAVRLILCNARAMGEFGAVSVVTARVSALTNTMPLEVANLYNDSGGYRPPSPSVTSGHVGLVTLAARRSSNGACQAIGPSTESISMSIEASISTRLRNISAWPTSA